jgi:tRNA threonylcarbamoyl adenosine modification protein YjeE
MSVISLSSLADTQALAARIAARVRVGDVITLTGDLGAGKTTFAQFLIQALSQQAVEVTSPTFTLLQTYPVTLANGVACELYHYDLYRIEHESALIELGFDDALAGVTLIEWPERLGSYRLPVSLALSITLADDGSRRVTLMGDARWKDVEA